MDLGFLGQDIPLNYSEAYGVNDLSDSGDVVGYAGSPSIDSHAVLWRGEMAIDLGV